MADWLELADVKSFLGLTPADVYDDEALANATAAAEPFVERARPDAFPLEVVPLGLSPRAPVPDFTEKPTADVYFAGLQLAARLYGRRNSPQGVAAFNDFGGAVYVSKFDPDIERALRIGMYSRPVVG